MSYVERSHRFLRDRPPEIPHSKEPPKLDLLQPAPELPLLRGVSEEDLHAFLRSIPLSCPPFPKEDVTNYCDQHLRRFIYTYGLVRDLKGRCLELGAAPYFFTILMKQFTELELVLANYFGPSHEKDPVVQEVSYNDFYTNERRTVKLDYHHFNIEIDPFPSDDAEFEVVLFCEIIEHLLMDPVAVLREIKRVLKPDGVLILTTPNANKLENIMKMIDGDNIYDPYSGYYGPYGRHNREYNVRELYLLLDYCGFTIETMFTADTQEKMAKNDATMILLEPMLRRRKNDLGQYIFVRALNTKRGTKKKPTFLYTNYPPDELEEVTIASIQLQEDIIVQEPSLIRLGKGWHGLESWDSILTRWMSDDATLHVYSDTNRTADLSFQALSFHRPRTLEIYVNDRPLIWAEVPTESFVMVKVPVNPNESINFVRFHVSEGCERPCDIPELDNRDSRCLSLAIQSITITD